MLAVIYNRTEFEAEHMNKSAYTRWLAYRAKLLFKRHHITDSDSEAILKYACVPSMGSILLVFFMFEIAVLHLFFFRFM